MVDAFSTAAAAIPLAQIAIGLGLQLCNLISELKGASDELQRLNREVEKLTGIIAEIRDLTQNRYKESDFFIGNSKIFSNLESGLGDFVTDLIRLGNIIGKLSGQHDTIVYRCWKKVKFVLNQSKIREISSRLQEHRSTLQFALQTVSEHDHNAMRKTLSHVATGINGIRETQATMHSQASESAAKLHDQFLKIRRSMDSLKSLICRIPGEDFNFTRHECKTTVLLRGSVENGAASLSALRDDICCLILPSELDIPQTLSPDAAHRFHLQFGLLLGDVWTWEARKMVECRPTLDFSMSQTHWIDSADWESLRLRSPMDMQFLRGTESRIYSRSSASVSCVRTNLIGATISNGSLFMVVKRLYKDVGWINSNGDSVVVRFLFVPTEDSVLSGIAAAVVLRFVDGTIRLTRALSTFAIHPENSPIFEYLKTGNVMMVCKMFSEGRATPNDRDPRGNSILWYAIFIHNYDMCCQLLRHGADPSDCDIYGDHALGVLLSNLPKVKYDTSKTFQEVLSLIRLLVTDCGLEAHGFYQYKRRLNVENAAVGLLHCLLTRQNSHFRILEPLNLILEEGFETEVRDVNGNTPLLCALYYTPQCELVDVVKLLLRYKAEVLVNNKWGEGCLHLLLRRISACNNYNMDSTTAESLTGILADLLHRKCDPTLCNIVGFTPIDAALSPAAWPLMCHALERTENDIKSVLWKIDKSRPIAPLSDAELSAKFAHFITQGGWKLSRPPRIKYNRNCNHSSCYLCGGHTDWRARTIPFDEFTSRVVEEVGFGIHMMLCNHDAADICEKIQEEDSAHNLDYITMGMDDAPARESSWRRYLAYFLWQEGILRNSGDCLRWSEDLESFKPVLMACLRRYR